LSFDLGPEPFQFSQIRFRGLEALQRLFEL
jgi:hypothetical protein